MSFNWQIVSIMTRRGYSKECTDAVYEILSIETEFPGIVQKEFFDHLKILADSARAGKYPLNNWMEKNGKKCDRKTNYESIQRHVDQAKISSEEKDKDSGRHPNLHAACRLMMDHVRISQKIIHDKDKE